MLYKSWATTFDVAMQTESMIQEQTLSQYQEAVKSVLHYLTADQQTKYCELIKHDLQSKITAGRMRKLLLDARYAMQLRYPQVDVFSYNRRENLAQIFQQKEIPLHAQAFCNSNNLVCPNRIILEGTGYQLNCADFLATNDSNFVSYKNYIRILNVYCALAQTLIVLESFE